LGHEIVVYKHRVAFAAAFVALVAAGAATGATTVVTINLQGGTGSRTLMACGDTHHYVVYRAGTRIQISGVVRPVPRAFRVKLKVKQCVHGAFRAIWSADAHTRSGGTYRGAFLARHEGVYFARAYLHIGPLVTKSLKKHFQVR
jgi:hypothetical protein